MKNKNTVLSVFCILTLLINTLAVYGEEALYTYTGVPNAQEIINNIDYKDVASLGSAYWANDAIYKMSALSIIQGYGEKSFRPKNNVTKAEAIALVYRALGKEADAMKEGQALEEKRTDDAKKKNARSVWSDGYLSLAQKDGLITQDEFDQAIDDTLVSDEPGVFNPNSTAQRQEVANWIAKAFKIKPVYNPTYIFNYFNDWESIDQDKIPYVEALLNSKIMNGDRGYFYPNQSLKRDEMAQVLSNLEAYIYKQNKLGKASGFVENISTQAINNLDKESLVKNVSVRLSDGSLANISLGSAALNTDSAKEVGQHEKNWIENEVIVNRNGVLSKSNALKKDDEILFVYDQNKKVKYIKAESKKEYENIYYGSVMSVDDSNNTIEFSDDQDIQRNFLVSQGAIISIDNQAKELGDIPFGARAYFTVNHNIISRIEVTNSKRDQGDLSNINRVDVRGIVQEINPNLNYVSLYNENGKKDLELIRTYNFTPDTKINKNGQEIGADKIEVGDTVYIRFDEDYNIDLINVESNYITKTGEILYKGNNFITVRFNDDTNQQLNLDDNILVVKDGELINKNDIIPGDKVKLTLNQNDSGTKIKAINIQGDGHYITSIYKGKFSEIYDDYIVLENPKVLNKDKWIIKNQKGFGKIDLDEKVKMYYNNKLVDTSDAGGIFAEKNIYVAVYKDYGLNEKAVMITSSEGSEKVYNDTISSQSASGKLLGLENSFDDVNYGAGTIVIKHGRLTMPSNIRVNDPVYAVSLRTPVNSVSMAQVINVSDKPTVEGIDIYRARISSIDEGNSFNVESFSILRGTSWDFINTPKTFDLTPSTRIVNAQGLINNRDFIDYSTGSFKDKIVYVAADGTAAKLVSDGIYGVINLRGEIYNTSSQGANSNSNTLSLKDVYVLNMTTGNWNAIGEGTVDVISNTIIIKNGDIVGMDKLEIYDKIRVIKKDSNAAGEALIVLVEG